MMKKDLDDFNELLKKAIYALKENEKELASIYLHKAMIENEHSPAVQNLLGIIAELKNDLPLASKHFRAAYALDPTYQPALDNLERVTDYSYRRNINKINFGNDLDIDTDNYFIGYDNNGVTSVIKRG